MGAFYYHQDNPTFPNYCLYRPNSNLAIQARGLSWMLYQKNLVLEEPLKVYLLSIKKKFRIGSIPI